jgi:ATP-dependent DNA helicase RecG
LVSIFVSLIHCGLLKTETPIEYLKGVGPARAQLFQKELGIFFFRHLLFYYPFRYVDRSQFYTISQLNVDTQFVQIVGRLGEVKELGEARQKRLVADFYDHTGKIELVWFKGIKWVKPSLTSGMEYVVFGKPTAYKNKLNIAHPDLETLELAKRKVRSGLQPVYSTTEKLSAKGLNSKGIEKLMEGLIPEVLPHISENLPDWILSQYRLVNRHEAIKNIHFPEDAEKLSKAQFRLKFEELFFIQLTLLRLKLYREKTTKGYVFQSVGSQFMEFFDYHLPFELTNAQKRVIKEIRKDLGSGIQMNRLLQGDVGSGKTIVALLSMLLAMDNGFQAALMAPTEILATQHFEGIKELLGKMEVEVRLLCGSTKKAERREIHEALENGSCHILVGTHALLEDPVQFQNLGLVVIDEQHRFGVAQRAKMYTKNELPPHILVMSATPIPRTLAMTLYGDLEVSIIDELPPGRKPIETRHLFDSKRAEIFGFMRKQIALGRQVYVVYPLIQESEKLDYKDLMDGFDSISRAFPLPDFKVSIVHGQMKAEDKDYEMKRFVKGETQIMVATTVIEVGVNVPNASVMVIESAERFGLSQLHQLRGRVGRGADQSYCLLVTSFKLTSDAKLRMETMVRTNDGFEVAETDLRLRGPGDLMGTQQSGILNLTIADLAKDTQILQLARLCASELLQRDPNLSLPEHIATRSYYKQLMKEKPDWSKVS